MTRNNTDRGAVDRISDSIRQAIAADASSDIRHIIESARQALVEAEAVSLFGLETPHPDFGSVHWIVGRTDPADDGEYVVLGIAEHSSPDSAPGEDRPLFAAGAEDLGEAFRQLPPGFVDASEPADWREPELLSA
ncbi:hypothetical protein [Microbaculum marinum]|uniref:Immunity protein Imm1 n=1 Tax=Microbaculum marinum TaxID=1764581 RepID=A0AAW9RDH2_9HYPH